MDGQDLLSAALDECGLGDLFSSPVRILSSLVYLRLKFNLQYNHVLYFLDYSR